MNSWSVLLFFTLIVGGGAAIDMLAAGTTLTDTSNNLNPVMNANQLSLSDVSLGENNPIGQSFGGNILISPTQWKAWVNSIFMNYEWLDAPNTRFIIYSWRLIASALMLFLGVKAAAGILSFLPFGGRR
tara:strand:- start:2743 stop:3129 length:387 start_codon:yes stop_codon:yes gene_type:complete